jgi:hypothetical protein
MNEGMDNAITSVVSLVSRRDSASVTTFVTPGLNSDLEVEPNKLDRPLMLGDCGEALVKQKLQVVMVCSDHERPTPKVGMPMLHGLHESDQLTLICS